jgi:hypothetical protein
MQASLQEAMLEITGFQNGYRRRADRRRIRQTYAKWCFRGARRRMESASGRHAWPSASLRLLKFIPFPQRLLSIGRPSELAEEAK